MMFYNLFNFLSSLTSSMSLTASPINLNRKIIKTTDVNTPIGLGKYISAISPISPEINPQRITSIKSDGNFISHVLSNIGIKRGVFCSGPQDTFSYNFRFSRKVQSKLATCSFFKSRAYEFNRRPKRIIPRGLDLSRFLNFAPPSYFKHNSHILLNLLTAFKSLTSCVFSYLIPGFETLSFGVARPSLELLSRSGQATRDCSLIPWESTRRLRPTVHNTESVETATLEVGITPLTPVPSKLSGLPYWSIPRGKAYDSIPAGYPHGLKKKEPLAGKSMFAWGYKTDAKGSLISFECSTSDIPTHRVM